MKLKYLAKGAILAEYDFTDRQGGTQSEVSEGIKEGTLQSTIMESTPRFCGLFTTTAEKTKKIDFRFLPYVQGGINYCESMGADVLSAYFSGCIMARYKRDGVWRVCHVSTGGTNDCKAKWEEIKIETNVSDVTEFKPHESIRASTKILGLITNTGEFYAIGCNPINNPKGGKMLLQVNELIKI